jgi:hypothetical protein
VRGLVLDGKPSLFYLEMLPGQMYWSARLAQRLTTGWTHSTVLEGAKFAMPEWLDVTVADGATHVGCGMRTSGDNVPQAVQILSDRTGNWQTEFSHDGGSGSNFGRNIALTTSGDAAMAVYCCNSIRSRIALLEQGESHWTQTIPAPDSPYFSYTVVYLDAASIGSHRAVLVSEDGSNDRIYFGTDKSGTWAYEQVCYADEGRLVSFDGQPAFLATKQTGSTFLKFYRLVEDAWVPEIIRSGGSTRGECIAVIDGKPTVSYFDYADGLHVAVRTAQGWEDTLVVEGAYNYWPEATCIFEVDGRPALAFVNDDKHGHYTLQYAELIPEPATVSMLAIGGLALLRRRRRRRRD